MTDSKEPQDVTKETQQAIPAVSMELPMYKSHKTVWALKIAKIEHDKDLAVIEGNRETDGSAMLSFEEEGYAPIKVPSFYLKKHEPQVGGYFVVYEDGYQSFSPAAAFEKGNTAFVQNSIEGLTFGKALEAAKAGKLISREGWNEKGMFVFQRPADELEIGFIIEKVKSLPQSLKDFFYRKNEKEMRIQTGTTTVKFSSYLCMYAADGSIVNGWLASQTDMLANDWCIQS